MFVTFLVLVWKTPTKRMPGINVDKIYARNMFFLTKRMPGIDYVDKMIFVCQEYVFLTKCMPGIDYVDKMCARNMFF